MRRFYTAVDVEPAEVGHAVRLDGRVARSPGGRPLAVPTLALARLIVAEWEAQGEAIDWAAMPATRLAQTALDGVAAARSETIAEIVRYAGADLACYFAPAPASLVTRQEALWTPLLDRARDELGLHFVRAVGVVHQPQPAGALARVASLAAAESDFALAGLAFGSALFGSAILALALRRGWIDAGRAVAAARLDEDFQAERWGSDPEIAARATAMAAEASMLERWFAALA